MWRRDAHTPALSAFHSDGVKPGFLRGNGHCHIMQRAAPEYQNEIPGLIRATGAQIDAVLDAKPGITGMEPMDLLADTRRSLADAIRQLAAIEAGAPIAKPLTREQAINIVTEQIGLFESVLRRYGDGRNAGRT